MKQKIIEDEKAGSNQLPIIMCNTCNEKAGSNRCGRCHSRFYCSLDCQKLDWKDHKLTCKPIIQ